MPEESQIFHESWYRIAGQSLSLRSSVRVRRQMFRGALWYVLFDPFGDQFYRLRPSAYRFVARLSERRTVEDVWKESIAADPDNAPGQEEVIQLLAQLYHANLLHYELPADSAKLFERYRETRQKIRRAALANIMFFRLPLFDPDRMLQRLLPIVKPLMGPVGAVLWLAVVGWGGKVAIDNFAALSNQSQGILALANIPLLYLGMIIVKALHELGHAFAVRGFGGEVHSMGVMFLIFNPLPYVDATASWAFRSKWKRALVGAAGMIVELFVAAVAVFLWAGTGPGVLHSLAYNMIFVASVSTILFNINPLLRFDGYYILSDLLDIPNLHTQASQQLRHLVERYAFGWKKSRSPASGAKDAFWLTVFGIASGIYRVVVFASILLFVADRLLVLGLLMAAICAVAWVVAPAMRLIRYLASDPRLERTRLRAVLVCLVALAGTGSLLYLVRFPSSFAAPGVLEATQHAYVVNPVEGRVAQILVSSGAHVPAGTPLVRLDNEEIDFAIREADGSLSEVTAMEQKALSTSQADLKAVQSLGVSMRGRLERLRQDKADLLVRAEIGGIWVAPGVEDLVGMWLRRGTAIGQLVDDSSFRFASVVSQDDVSQVFSGNVLGSEVRLAGEADVKIVATSAQVIPMEQKQLPSRALGFGGGGEVAVDTREASGAVAAQPFYEVRVAIPSDCGAALLHGRSGRVRFRLNPEPLLLQWHRRLRQLVQSRYQL